MPDNIDPDALELQKVTRSIAELRAQLAEARRRKAELRRKINAKIVVELENNPETSNVQLASRFGLASETSVRNLRSTVQCR